MKNLPAIVDTDSQVVDAEIVDVDYPEAKEVVNQNNAKAERLAELEARRVESAHIGHIDNGSLWAGSPMYFYCKFCGTQTDVLPENYFLSTPSTICNECQVLIDFGWHDGKMPYFPSRAEVAAKKQQEDEKERKAITRKAAAAKGATTRAKNKAAKEKKAKQATKPATKKK